MAVHLLRFDQIDSTSLHGRRLIESELLPRQAHVLVAARQTGGIGRHGRRWSSPAGGLWMTVLWPLETQPLPATLSLQIGLAVCGVLQRAVGPGLALCCKWPNDVLCGDKKLAGTLIETAAEGGGRWLMVGIGCNINNRVETLASDLHETAASVVNLTGQRLELEIFRKRLVAAVLGVLVRPLEDAAAAARFCAHMWGNGREVEATLPDGARVRGVVRGIDAEGRLLLETGSGVLAIASVSGYG